LAKFNPLKIDLIRDELWINCYEEMMNLCTPDWEFFEEIDTGFKWPKYSNDVEDGCFNTLVFIREIPALNVSESEAREIQNLRDRISMAECLENSRLKICERRRKRLSLRVRKLKSELLSRFFELYPLMRIFNVQRFILCFLVYLRGSYRLGLDKAVDLAITVYSYSLASACAWF
jgi:hypothetical protein